jgi:quercetin dioxygenase-like cupin family protein
MGRSFLIGLAAAALLGSTPATAQQSVEAFTPAEIQWGDGPARLPSNVKVARLQGSPDQPGLFAVRLKLPAGYKLGAHWHPRDEIVTVLSGTVYFGTGERFNPAQAKAYPAGSFVVLPANVPHFTWTKGEAVIQAHGIGPLDFTYVNPADDPRRQ